jgi:hypothetical protein
MKKIFFRVILLLVAIILLLMTLFNNRSPFGRSNNSFSTEPKNEITKIEFSEQGKKLTLEKDKDNWLINGLSESRKSGILFIDRILKRMEIKSPVSLDIFEKEIVKKGVAPVRVRVFEKRKLINSFLVYKTPDNIYGNIMKMKEGAKPFIVFVPGFGGDIGSAFTTNEFFWQPYIIFNQLPSEIASVTFENLSDTSSSFSIVNINNNFILSDLKHELSGWNSSHVERYLSYFTWIPFESWDFAISDEAKKLLDDQSPLYRITVKVAGGREIILRLWQRMSDKGDHKIDSDRLLGKIQDIDEIFIVRYFDIDPIIKRREYFFQ